jgi:hypothetical protein
MDAPLLTRRAALARALKFGSAAAIAAAVGCHVEGAREPTPAPRASLEATPRPTRTATPYVTPSPSPTPPPEVRLDVIPTALSIPTLGIEAPVFPAQTAAGAGGSYEILVPESGLVSPNHLIGDHSVNTVWILGHSRWHRVPQLLYTTANLNAGDTIAVAGRDRRTERELSALTFEVERLVLTDQEFAGREIYAQRAQPRLILQTSVRQLYDPEWILDRATLEAKAEVAVETSVDDLSRYLLLLVVGRLREESMASLLANA